MALAGAGVCGPVVTMIGSVAFLVGIGGAPLMSMKMGQGDNKAAERDPRQLFFNARAVFCPHGRLYLPDPDPDAAVFRCERHHTALRKRVLYDLSDRDRIRAHVNRH